LQRFGQMSILDILQTKLERQADFVCGRIAAPFGLRSLEKSNTVPGISNDQIVPP
jgi:4'-phosphopantetheinyl transferase EntD